VPRYTTSAAFDDFAYTLVPAIDRETVRRAELRVASGLGLHALPDRDEAVVPAPERKPHLIGIDGAKPGSAAVRRRR
jgi:hypothetical protein